MFSAARTATEQFSLTYILSVHNLLVSWLFFHLHQEIYLNVSIVWLSKSLMPFSKWSLERFPSKYLLRRQFSWIFSLPMNIHIRNVNRNKRQFAKFVYISRVVEKDALIGAFINASLLFIFPFVWHLVCFYNQKIPMQLYVPMASKSQSSHPAVKISVRSEFSMDFPLHGRKSAFIAASPSSPSSLLLD